MTTNRNPVRRARRSQITPAAVLLFRDMEADDLRGEKSPASGEKSPRKGECTCPDDFKPGVNERCPGCTRRSDAE
jgi:hypothetical protein